MVVADRLAVGPNSWQNMTPSMVKRRDTLMASNDCVMRVVSSSSSPAAAAPPAAPAAKDAEVVEVVEEEVEEADGLGDTLAYSGYFLQIQRALRSSDSDRYDGAR